MPYALLANLVLLLHAVFIVFVAGGGVLLWRWPRLIWLHLPAVVWGVLNALSGWPCPLTPLEHHLLSLAGGAEENAGWFQQLLLSLVYPVGLTRPLQVALGVGLVVITMAIYGAWWWRVLRR